jgi:hypothetical protein
VARLLLSLGLFAPEPPVQLPLSVSSELQAVISGSAVSAAACESVSKKEPARLRGRRSDQLREAILR